MSEVDDRQPAELEDRLRAGDDVLYRVPVIDHPISVNEFHAHVIGIGSGILVTVAYLIGYEAIGFFSGAGLVGYALFGRPFLRSLSHDADEYEKSIALKTIRWEPWHFLGAFLLGVGAITLTTGTWLS
ncbi:hypothetical protein [Natronosalvus rutilus]|uniref:Uncharacterized protein n=1 Tax=Natronosalvus rutilus TaxID=2953753 RepID=A0A9E7NFB8_9EURY|nr:hypothetical protein [Natronosalvus rutilus]UTF55970.1 hypothetical protein NGM29_20985 [Natronosalvus rutilus]